MKTYRSSVLLLLAMQTFLAGGAFGVTQRIHEASLSSGVFANTTGEFETHVVGEVKAVGAARVRVPLSVINLGRSSKIRFVSLADGQSQTLDSAQLALWSYTSALFNGDAVRLELVVAAGDQGVSVQVTRVLGFVDQAESDGVSDCCGGGEVESLCGPDNRGSSSDNRVGRIGGRCTGWLVSNGAVLTAGHCGIGAGEIFEVNVPASLANGTQVTSAIQDQYPVIAGSITTVNLSIGHDWSVFRIGPNSLNQSAFQYGYFRMTRELPAGNATTRVTGCGIDNSPLGSQPMVCGNTDTAGNCTHFGLNAQNQTLQTSTGAFSSEVGGGNAISLRYAVDTEPANSGSSIIWEGNGFTVGIHTNGGCTTSGGTNSGTSFELDALENAIAAVPGPNCRYLDFVKAPGGAENGTVFEPHDSLGEAINSVPVGGTLSVVGGSYSAVGVPLDKAMTITAPVGTVHFGN